MIENRVFFKTIIRKKATLIECFPPPLESFPLQLYAKIPIVLNLLGPPLRNRVIRFRRNGATRTFVAALLRRFRIHHLLFVQIEAAVNHSRTAQWPRLLGAHVAKIALGNRNEVRSERVLAVAQFRRALVLEFAHDQMAGLRVGGSIECAWCFDALYVAFERMLVAKEGALGIDDSVIVCVGVIGEVLQRRHVE